MKSILDVGCGHYPKGTVNVDLYVEATRHRSFDQRKLDDKPLNVKAIPNFVKADALHLPFKDSCFNVVYSAHTIEHVDNPLLMLKEMARVTKHIVIIKCPHRFAKSRKKPAHKNSFTVTRLKKLLATLNMHVVYSRVKYRGFPHPFFAIIQLPREIYVKAEKIPVAT